MELYYLFKDCDNQYGENPCDSFAYLRLIDNSDESFLPLFIINPIEHKLFEESDFQIGKINNVKQFEEFLDTIAEHSYNERIMVVKDIFKNRNYVTVDASNINAFKSNYDEIIKACNHSDKFIERAKIIYNHLNLNYVAEGFECGYKKDNRDTYENFKMMFFIDEVPKYNDKYRVSFYLTDSNKCIEVLIKDEELNGLGKARAALEKLMENGERLLLEKAKEIVSCNKDIEDYFEKILKNIYDLKEDEILSLKNKTINAIDSKSKFHENNENCDLASDALGFLERVSVPSKYTIESSKYIVYFDELYTDGVYEDLVISADITDKESNIEYSVSIDPMDFSFSCMSIINEKFDYELIRRLENDKDNILDLVRLGVSLIYYGYDVRKYKDQNGQCAPCEGMGEFELFNWFKSLKKDDLKRFLNRDGKEDELLEELYQEVIFDRRVKAHIAPIYEYICNCVHEGEEDLYDLKWELLVKDFLS